MSREDEMKAQHLEYLEGRRPDFVSMIMNLNEYKNKGMTAKEYKQALNSMKKNYDMPDYFLGSVIDSGNAAYMESRKAKMEGSLMTPREGYAEGSKVKKEKSLLKEIGKAYASIPKEASKATKRMAKNFYEDVVKEAPDMIKEIPGAIANIKQVKNTAEMIKDPFNLGDMMKVPEKTGGGRSKSRTRKAEGGTKFPDLTA